MNPPFSLWKAGGAVQPTFANFAVLQTEKTLSIDVYFCPIGGITPNC